MNAKYNVINFILSESIINIKDVIKQYSEGYNSTSLSYTSVNTNDLELARLDVSGNTYPQYCGQLVDNKPVFIFRLGKSDDTETLEVLRFKNNTTGDTIITQISLGTSEESSYEIFINALHSRSQGDIYFKTLESWFCLLGLFDKDIVVGFIKAINKDGGINLEFESA